MEIWLDTTNVRTVQKAVKYGLLAGVTTNPTLIAQSECSLEEVLEDLLHYQEGPVAAQVVAEEAHDMVQQGQNLHSMSNRIIIKVPITKNGLEAIHLLSRQGIPTMATAIFHPHQALLAAVAGADYVAPYLKHLEKMESNPWTTLKSITQMFEAYRIKTRILGASLAGVEYFVHCAETGIYGVTVKDDLLEALVETDAMTLKWVDQFASDWKKVKAPLLNS